MERLVLRAVIWFLGLFRLALSVRASTSALFHMPWLQRFLGAVGRLRAREVFLKARAECPAYARFLVDQGYRHVWRWRLAEVPVTDKKNYVLPYSIEARCYGGRIPGGGVVIDESSGSSGNPNNWVRSRAERRDVRRVLRLSYDLMYGDRDRVLLNCFALGPWATGMNVSMSLADTGILKSIGPDAAKLAATLRTLGPSYRYLVFAYPPFARAFVDDATLDLTGFEIDLVVGGEGMSEALRDHLRRTFRSVVSSYGASDLEINLAIETGFSIAVRQACHRDAALCRALFGRDTPPMVFQYNALDYLIETLPSGTLAFTICRLNGAAPKVRYDLKDVGGTMPVTELETRLRAHGVDPGSLAARRSGFPMLYVFGRGDLTVAFYGAKIYPTDLEAAIHARPDLAARFAGFQFSSVEDAEARKSLVIDLELKPDAPGPVPDATALRDAFFDGLSAANQDFREVTRMFPRDAIVVRVHEAGTGPFAGMDVRIKRKYIAEG
jgi:phenylacetate-CoA ligase